VVKLEILFFEGHLDHCNGSAGMNTSGNVPLRGIADTTRRVPAPPAKHVSHDLIWAPFATFIQHCKHGGVKYQ
jgi:hypothetical protein